MKFFASTAIAMALAATTAFAQSDSTDDMQSSQSNGQAQQSSEMGTDMKGDLNKDMKADMGNAGTGTKDMDSAQSDSAPDSDEDWTKSSAEMAQMTDQLIRTRDITGGPVYTTNEAHDEGEAWDMTYDEVGADWNQIGEIEDLVMSPEGKLIGIVAEVGGFLDIGDKHVLLSVADAKLVPVDDASYTFVTRFNEEQLEEMEGVDEGAWN